MDLRRIELPEVVSSTTHRVVHGGEEWDWGTGTRLPSYTVAGQGSRRRSSGYRVRARGDVHDLRGPTDSEHHVRRGVCMGRLCTFEGGRQLCRGETIDCVHVYATVLHVISEGD